MDPFALLLKVVIAVATFGVLVAVHEWGHFFVARRCGVKVLRFAIGFGPVVYGWKDKTGTEFALCALPLGGYVKMLDAKEGAVAASEHAYEFNQKHPWRRIAIAAAGPIANFILALIAFVVVFSIGSRGVAPVVGDVIADSPSAKAGIVAGDEVISIDGTNIQRWQDALQALMSRMGESGEVPVIVRRDDTDVHLSAPLDRWLLGAVEPDLLAGFGIEPYRVEIPATLGVIVDGSPAQAAGLLAGDTIIEFDGEPVDDWYGLVDLIQTRPNQTVSLVVSRDGESIMLTLTPAEIERDGEAVGQAGIGPEPVEYPPHLIRHFSYSGFAALTKAAEQVVYYSRFTLESFGKLLTGTISVKNLSGPISIAKVASDSAKYGLVSYLTILAILSISLGVLNLMPIPVLDGGHIVFHAIEWIKGSPVSDTVQDWSLKVGLSMVLCLMTFAIVNDFSRLINIKSLF